MPSSLWKDSGFQQVALAEAVRLVATADSSIFGLPLYFEIQRLWLTIMCRKIELSASFRFRPNEI
jgi:hypothetical protein